MMKSAMKAWISAGVLGLGGPVMNSEDPVENSLVAVIKALEYVEMILAAQPPPPILGEGEVSHWTLLRELKQYVEQAKRELS